MIESALILPTGDEIAAGIVLDTDSGEVLNQLLRLSPACTVVRAAPLPDREDTIRTALTKATGKYDLVVLIGGSGGGHRFSDTLGRDYTHSVLAELLSPCYFREIFGKNGHLWCKLLCGKREDTLFINLPGPFVEAQAAIKAFCASYQEHPEDLEAINRAMAKAVYDQYPAGKAADLI